ncbi:MAG: hypothetical protein KTR26_14100 [Flammeovirgaceae bacterium]|nr:hypothetical protein [Flammeovirgaceae bacterium]
MSRIPENSVREFIKIQKDLPDTLKSYGLSGSYVARKSGISITSFHRKMKNTAFTGLELERIIRVINK